jgi:hypothetical protein
VALNNCLPAAWGRGPLQGEVPFLPWQHFLEMPGWQQQAGLPPLPSVLCVLCVNVCVYVCICCACAYMCVYECVCTYVNLCEMRFLYSMLAQT